jgi:ATP-binding cassette subfamily C protein CydD
MTPALLLLDEPTASLDAHSEELVIRALDDASRHQATVLVTHQLTQIREFDIIWVMGNGQILQQGRFEQLSAQTGPFARLLAHRRGEC